MFNSKINKSNGPRVAIIGCGIFGAMTALRLAEAGAEVFVFERGDTPLLGASYNNQNRLHLGFHYPRDDETALQCKRGFKQFSDEFHSCILKDFSNAYFIAKNQSLTMPDEYLSFCDRIGLEYEILDLEKFSPVIHNVAIGLKTNETVYDCSLLRILIQKRLNLAGVKPFFDSDVTHINRVGSRYNLSVNDNLQGPFDAVINCTYANINKFNHQLGFPTPVHQYEYTMVPIIEWDHPAVGITIMDGRFMTVLPFGRTGKFLLYHVGHTVVSTHIGTQVPENWLELGSAPSQNVNPEELFNKFKKDCTQFVPDLNHVKLVGFLQGSRMVLANRDNTDARPSILNNYESGYWSVFTGKIDHCMWVSQEITDSICA